MVGTALSDGFTSACEPGAINLSIGALAGFALVDQWGGHAGTPVKLVVVLGHSGCGGIGALLRGAHDGDDFVVHWMQIAASARERALQAASDAEQAQRLCELESVKLSLGNLMTFPWVRGGVEQRRLKLHGCYFDIEKGDLLRLGDAGQFDPI